MKKNILTIISLLFSLILLSSCYVFLGPAGADGELPPELDITPPNTPIVTISSNIVTSSSLVSFSISGGDDNKSGSGFSHYEYEFFGNGQSASGQLNTLTGTISPSSADNNPFTPADGEYYYLFINSVDMANNKSSYTRAQIGLDSSAPNYSSGILIINPTGSLQGTISWPVFTDSFSGMNYYLLTLTDNDNPSDSCTYRISSYTNGNIYGSASLYAGNCTFISSLILNATPNPPLLDITLNASFNIIGELNAVDIVGNASAAITTSTATLLN